MYIYIYICADPQQYKKKMHVLSQHADPQQF